MALMGKQEKQRMFELLAGETWGPFLEEVNDLMHEEKAARHENDHIKVSEICLRIVRSLRGHQFLVNSCG